MSTVIVIVCGVILAVLVVVRDVVVLRGGRSPRWAGPVVAVPLGLVVVAAFVVATGGFAF